RLISASLFKKHYDPELKLKEGYYFSFWQFIKKAWKNNFGKFVIYVALIQFATNIAGPFFAVYMLKELQLSYFAFTLINLSALLSPILFLSFIGKRIDRIGTVRVMKASGFLISFVPLFWIFSIFLMKSSPLILIIYLFIIEFFSGFVWASYNLSTSNFIYDAVTKQKIILCFTYFGFINSIGSFLGGFIGGQLSSLSSFSIFGLGAILSVFLISFVLRLLPALFIAPKLKEVRQIEGSGVETSFRIKEKIAYFLKLITFNAPKT
ncbi:MAG: hypothetical protein NTZ83_04690, partial [Candidatus Pacearchaeota archaeon]|nr:hypothetical protein [Candidatus Pacearchaeota archaeon]